MPSNTDFPEKISKRNLTDSKILRELSSSAHSFALPFIHRGIGQLGLVCSLDAGRAFMQKNGFFIDDVLSLGGLIKKVSEYNRCTAPCRDEFFLVTIEAKHNLEAAGFLFHRGPSKEALIEFADAFPAQNGHAHRPHFYKNVAKSNINNPNLIRVWSSEIHKGIEHTQEAVDNDIPAVTKDGRFGILSRKHALELKEAMFGATTGIFIDRSVSELAQNYKRYTSLVEDGKNFIRIDERDSHRRVTPRDRVLVPGYALEFLDLDPDSGTITGVKNTNKLFMWFAMNGEIDTDFLHKTRFRLNSADIGKLNLVENAMKTLRTSNDLITVQNIRRPIHEQGKERRIRRTPGHMKFSCPVGISFTLYANGRASDVVIGSGRPNALCKAALSQPEDIDLIYRGRNYSLGF